MRDKRSLVRKAMKTASAWEEGEDWAFSEESPSKREFTDQYNYRPKHVKVLAKCLRSTMMALGHANSAHSRFAKLKSSDISPDGNLGGQGYMSSIPQMRRQLANVVEALSSLSDTLYDEIQAPHWQEAEKRLPPKERQEIEDLVEDSEEIRDDPEAWAIEEEEEADHENDGHARSKRSSMDNFEACYFSISDKRGQ